MYKHTKELSPVSTAIPGSPVANIMQNKIICPSCGGECYYNLDMYGRTVWHLHCDNCRITINVNNREKGIELLQAYHQPHTYLDYYENMIQCLIIDNKIIIDKELRDLLIKWQDYEHHGDYDESEKIAKKLKEVYGIDMENEEECDTILYNFKLIKGWEKYAE